MAILNTLYAGQGISSSGGTITGDLTISGDLTVSGGGDFSYSEVLTGDMKITNTAASTALEIEQNTGAGYALEISQNANAAGIYIDNNGTATGLDIENTGSTGRGMYVYSNIGATVSSPLVEFKTDNTAFDQPVLKLEQQGAAVALNVTHSTTNTACYLNHSGGNGTGWSIDTNTQTGYGYYVDTSALTTGSAIYALNTSANMATTAAGGFVDIVSTADTDSNINNLLFIHNDHADSTGTTGLKIQQDSTGPALVAMGNVGIGTAAPGTKLHISDATTNSILRLESTDTTVGSDDVIGSIEFYTNDAYDDGVGAKIMGVASNVNGQVSLTFSTGRPATITERVRIDDAGDVTVSTGNLVIGTAGKGIDFSNQASPNAGMTAELLDHYEEGIYDVTVTNDGTGFPLTADEEAASYTKIGDLVHVQGAVQIASEASATGDIKVSLPFTSGGFTDFSERSYGTVWLINTGGTNVGHMVAVNNGSASYFKIGQVADDGTNTYLTAANVDTSWFIGFQISYKTA